MGGGQGVLCVVCVDVCCSGTRFFPCGFPLAGLSGSFWSVDEGGFFRGFSLSPDSTFLSVNLTHRALVDRVALLAKHFYAGGDVTGDELSTSGIALSGCAVCVIAAGREAPAGLSDHPLGRPCDDDENR